MRPPSKLEGRRFGRLLVIERKFPNENWNTVWRCRCDCGAELIVPAIRLTRGNTASCGCLQRDRTREASTTHGRSKTSTFNIWSGMIKRCTNANEPHYMRYGGRGIKVCERWLKFENFLADMGERPLDLTLDRYPDNDGNYEPGNCRWASRKEQRLNNNANIFVQYLGERIPLAVACEKAGKKHHNVYMRMRRGRTFEEAIK